jgi:hypothetical protein
MHDLTQTERLTLHDCEVERPRFIEHDVTHEMDRPDDGRVIAQEGRFRWRGEEYGQRLDTATWCNDQILDSRSGQVTLRTRIMDPSEVAECIRRDRRALIESMMRTAWALWTENHTDSHVG